jgi:peptidyl-prolyl cis-trans isomerase C
MNKRLILKPVCLLIFTACLASLLLACGAEKQETEGTAPQPINPIAQPSGSPAPAAPVAAEPDGDAAVVTVEGNTLTQADLNEQVQRMFAAQGRNLPPQMVSQLAPSMQQRIVDGFIAQTVLVKEADRTGVEVPGDEVEKILTDMKGQLPEGVTFEMALSRMNVTETSLRDDINRDLKIRKLVEQQTADVPEASDEEIAAYYNAEPDKFEVPETAEARHILISCAPDAEAAQKEEKRQEAEALRKQLVEGGDFGALAKEHSDCPSSAKGGDLGSIKRGATVKPFEDAAFSQEIDAIGEVVETQFGYHVIQVSKREEARKQPLEEVKDDIAQMLQGQKKQETVQTYLAGLKEKAEITYGEGQDQ